MFAARAWVNFNGVTANTPINASGNVSSVTDIAVGSFRVNFTTAMPDTNYSFVGTVRKNDATITGYAGVIMPYLGDGKTTAALDLKSWQASMVLTDYPEVNIVVFR